MIALAVVLLVLGGAVAYMGRSREQWLFYAGILIFAAGAIVLIFWLFDVAEAEAAVGGGLAMALMPSNPTAKTKGLAPKVGWIGLATVALAVIVCVVDKLLLDDAIEDAVWQTLFGLVPVVLGVGAAAPAALQEPKGPEPDRPVNLRV